MTDYIRRADAIEAVRKEYEDAINIGDNGDAIAYDVERILSALPSANYITEKPNDAIKPSNDVISRADAIEEISKGVWNVHELIDRIKALPSADIPTEDYSDLPDIPRAYYEKIVGNMAHEINMLKEQLEDRPTRPSGEWLMFDGLYCSNCHYKLQTTGIPTYCPSCGARMKGGAE